jgi:hypothetical protein
MPALLCPTVACEPVQLQRFRTFELSRTPLPLSTPSCALPSSQESDDRTAFEASSSPLSTVSTAFATTFFTSFADILP